MHKWIKNDLWGCFHAISSWWKAIIITYSNYSSKKHVFDVEILNFNCIHCVCTPRVTIKTCISIDFLSTEGTIREASLMKSQKQIGLWKMGFLLYISMTINIPSNFSGFPEGYCKLITSQWSDNSRDSLEQRLWQVTLSLMSRNIFIEWSSAAFSHFITADNLCLLCDQEVAFLCHLCVCYHWPLCSLTLTDLQFAIPTCLT